MPVGPPSCPSLRWISDAQSSAKSNRSSSMRSREKSAQNTVNVHTLRKLRSRGHRTANQRPLEQCLNPLRSVPAEQGSSARYAEAGVAVAPERAAPSRGGREMGRDDATTSDEWDDGGRSSHGGHPVDLDVPHRTVAVSANHFLPIDDRRLRGDALQPVLRYRPVRPLPADPPDHEADHAEDRDDREDPETEVERRQLEQDRAVSQGLVVPRRTVRDPVTPERRVYARVQFRASLFAVPGHLKTRSRRH
ncbi:hypothetical protein K0M31_006160 [Melipona bicolor]|uniref:Uncharacterized protein n=1 Tax=Melipona bicolor TaxID=60889 RepID=A0AA40FSZ0_9HYME|nr:hypothetical protein K0M31_006160 [Melipona bicolor]